MSEPRKVPGRAYDNEKKRAVIEKILEAWQTEKCRGLRLGQLIVNAGIREPFYVEDAELADLVDTYANG